MPALRKMAVESCCRDQELLNWDGVLAWSLSITSHIRLRYTPFGSHKQRNCSRLENKLL